MEMKYNHQLDILSSMYIYVSIYYKHAGLFMLQLDVNLWQKSGRMVVRKSFDCKMLFTEKKCNLEVEIYYCVYTEDLNPGDSLSNSSDGLLQRGKE